MNHRILVTVFGAITCLLLQVPVAQAERVKDLASVRGVRSNQLIGYGLVIGLAGTGDTNTTTFTTQSIIAMLARNNVRVGVQGLRLANVAAVMVTAELPPFSRVGNRIDVTVSSIGDAQSLVGGTLVVTLSKAITDKSLPSLKDHSLWVVFPSVMGTSGKSVITRLWQGYLRAHWLNVSCLSISHSSQILRYSSMNLILRPQLVLQK